MLLEHGDDLAAGGEQASATQLGHARAVAEVGGQDPGVGVLARDALALRGSTAIDDDELRALGRDLLLQGREAAEEELAAGARGHDDRDSRGAHGAELGPGRAGVGLTRARRHHGETPPGLQRRARVVSALSVCGRAPIGETETGSP